MVPCDETCVFLFGTEKSFPAVIPKGPGAITPKSRPSKQQLKPGFPFAGPRHT